MGLGENEKRQENTSCQLIPGGLAGTGPNGSFFESQAWVDKVSLFHIISSHHIWPGQGPGHDLPDPVRGSPRLVDQAGHWHIPLLQPQPGLAHHRPRRLLPLPLRLRGGQKSEGPQLDLPQILCQFWDHLWLFWVLACHALHSWMVKETLHAQQTIQNQQSRPQHVVYLLR